jgi:hypothetical protein
MVGPLEPGSLISWAKLYGNQSIFEVRSFPLSHRVNQSPAQRALVPTALQRRP